MRAYFELLLQPAKNIPYTPKEEITKINNKLLCKSNNFVYKSNDITIHPKKLKNNVIKGENINKKLLDLIGIIISFKINFKPSANGCKKPKNPTIFGPVLR